jgi:hypothetical protein
VDRRAGHAVALEAIAAVVRRVRSPARRLTRAAGPALRGALALAGALAPARLLPAGA